MNQADLDYLEQLTKRGITMLDPRLFIAIRTASAIEGSLADAHRSLNFSMKIAEQNALRAKELCDLLMDIIGIDQEAQIIDFETVRKQI